MSVLEWLNAADELWTRYRTLMDLHGRAADDPAVLATRRAMLDHAAVQELVETAAQWPGYALKRHNDSRHPLHTLTVLADFGLTAGDPGMAAVVDALLKTQSDDGAFQILTNINPRYGGTGEDQWHWSLCDAPVILHALIAFGLGAAPRVQRGIDHLLNLAGQDGWRCVTATGFRGPGRKEDPCPLANLLALRALALLPETWAAGPAVAAGAEMLLTHWERQTERKIYLFGIGTDFRKLKYPLIWYDLLHVTHVLSMFPWLRDDPRLGEMVALLAAGADADGCFTPTSIWMPWKGWSFGQKKEPSPWVTLLATRILRRMGAGCE